MLSFMNKCILTTPLTHILTGNPLPISIPAPTHPAYDYLETSSNIYSPQPIHTSSDISPPNPHVHASRRSTRVSKPPSWLSPYDVSTSLHHRSNSDPSPMSIANSAITSVPKSFANFITTHTSTQIPHTFSEAVCHQPWVDAMNVELQALEANDTWEITDLPKGRKAIGTKWLYKVKYNPDGSIERNKARLVVLGNRQRAGIDYGETFAPVAKMTTVRSILAVAALKNWHTFQMDVTNAFLHGDLLEDVYMTIPLGYNGIGHPIQFNQPASSVRDNSPNKVLKLKKSLYGLKQAPRQWFAKLSSALLSFGFQQSKADYSLFTHSSPSHFTAILIYVDDLLIVGDNMAEIEKLKSLLSSQFHMKDLGKLRYFLGLEVDRSESGIFLSQKKYALDLIKEHEMESARPLKVSLDTHVKLVADKGDLLPNPDACRRLIGQLIYITITRPDIAFSVQLLSQYMQSPTNVHLQAAKRLLRYLKSAPSQGILLASTCTTKLTPFCDSDWASCPDSRKSTTGFCILLGDSPISWKSKKQNVVARSSAEAEYRVMSLTACELIWLNALLKDLCLKNMPTTTLHCDNHAAIFIAANPVYHERTKHIEVDCHFVQDKIQQGVLQTKYVHTSNQLADILTKILPMSQHQKLLHKLGVSSSTHSKLEGECRGISK